jgi:hypothetical protein
MTKFECHKLQEVYFNVQGYFEYPRKILCRFKLREIGSHESVQTTQSKRLDAHQSITYVRTRWQYHFYVMLLFSQGCCLFQSLQIF